MNTLFRNTLGPTAWIIMGAIPLAIFALYFLKLKRQPLEVPSTYLWHRVIEDLHVNSFWQRLRKSLLLFLQLLVAALAVLALLRPGWQGQTLEGQRFIFLVDNSASMSTNDAAGGNTRLEDAKNRLGELIDQMESSMSAMIIAFAHEPVVVQEFTSNRRMLRDALARIEPTAEQTDFKDALRLAGGFANPRKEAANKESEDAPPEELPVELYIFSDGRFAAVEDFSLGNLDPKFLPLGGFETQNMAITALNARRGEANVEQQQAFVQIANASGEDSTVTVELQLNDQLVDALEIKVPAKGTGSATFLLNPDVQGTLRATLDLAKDYQDRLTLDNTAYAVVGAERSSRVLLVTPGNNSLEVALRTARAMRLAKVEQMSPDVLKTPEFEQRVANGNFDLIIFDQCMPTKMPSTNTVFIGRVPPLKSWEAQSLSETVYAPQIIDWDRSHPLLNLIELSGIQIADAHLVKPPPGGRVLIDSTAGPLASIAPRERFEDVAIGFEIVGTNADGERTFNTDWPRKHSFPSFWLNVLEHFAAATQSQTNYRPGNLVELRLPAGTKEATIRMPDGSQQHVDIDLDGRMAFQDTHRLGVYQVDVEGKPVKQFAVNLFDSNESDVALRMTENGENGLDIVENLNIGYVEVSARPPNADIRKELWKGLLVLALVVLFLEWYIYNRRVYI